MKRVLFVSVNRSDYGIWRSILRALKDEPEVTVGLFVTGGHLSRTHGRTIEEVHQDGFYDEIFAAPCTLSDDTAIGAAGAISLISNSFSLTISQFNPDFIFVLGDRYEVLAASLTASLFRIPIVHFHGGCVTEGALDDSYRHAITKLSSKHFVECEEFKHRLMQLGEDESHIQISGAPSLGELKCFEAAPRIQFCESVGLSGQQPFVLATLHSETTKSLEYNAELARNFFAALEGIEYDVLITAPNPDPSSAPIAAEITSIVRRHPNRFVYRAHLGHQNYFNAMTHCAYLAGNSSSGIIEAASFKKVALNVGERQKNRAHDRSVIHCDCSYVSITEKLRQIPKIDKSNLFDGWTSMYFVESPARTVTDFLSKVPKKYSQKSFVDRRFVL